MTKEAFFLNFTDKPFTGYWNGKPYTFKPGDKRKMLATIAGHFAKHLTNQELLKKGGEFENYTSPKKPEQVPAFMDIFNKAFIPLATEVDEIGLTPDPLAAPSMDIHVQARKEIDPYDSSSQKDVTPAGVPTIIAGPDGGVGDDESEYETKE